MASGVQVSDECLSAFQQLKLGKRHKYIIYALRDDFKEIVVKKTSAESDYNKFLDDLPEDECRWAVYDFEFEKGSDGKRNKLLFVSWAPDTAKIKPKMVYASSRDALKRKLDGIAVEVQATDSTEVSLETILAKVSSGSR